MTGKTNFSCGCYAGLLVPSAVPKARGTLRVDHAALRVALGGNSEIVEAMEAKAKGKPVVNAVDAIRAGVHARKTRAGEGRFEVTETDGKGIRNGEGQIVLRQVLGGWAVEEWAAHPGGYIDAPTGARPRGRLRSCLRKVTGSVTFG